MAKPYISVIMPTLNAARVLEESLASLASQNYPENCIELLVIDGGSSDSTRDIALHFGAKILENPLLTTEAGAAIGLKAAKGEFVAFIDSDNVLVGDDWFERMLAPFEDPAIVGAEPMRFVVRSPDGYLTRYFARLGMADPLCLFLGNYDHYCELTQRWTDLPIRTVARCGYDKVWLTPGKVPTIGCNGLMMRRDALVQQGIGDYWFDVDVVNQIIERRRSPIARVPCGIVHVYVKDVRSFCRKQRRRIRDFLYFRREGMRPPNQAQFNARGVVHFGIFTVLGWPLLVQALVGYARSSDLAWFFHPAACALTLYEYAIGVLLHRWQKGPMTRVGWKQ